MQRNEKTKALRAQISKLVEEYAAIALASNTFVPGSTMVPPSGKLIDAIELKNMVEASLDGWLTSGRFNFNLKKACNFSWCQTLNYSQLRLISQPLRLTP